MGMCWEDNIRMDLQEVGLGYEDWIGLAQGRDRWRALVNDVMNLRVTDRDIPPHSYRRTDKQTNKLSPLHSSFTCLTSHSIKAV